MPGGDPPRVAFVLGGGGLLGANQVGALRALLEAGIRPDLILGTSVGAVNGVVVAADPTPASVDRLGEVWSGVDGSGIFSGNVVARLATLAKTRVALHEHSPLRRLLGEALAVSRIEDLVVSFQCVAASIERASEHWFTKGSIVDAVTASTAVPGLLPPVEIAGEHFYDGGIVNSIPVGRAVTLGADTIYVLHVGRIDRPLEPPTWPWEAGLVAFEIARRHRFATDVDELPDGVELHVMPTGSEAPQYNALSQLRYTNAGPTDERIESAYRASAEYLETLPR